MRNTPRRYVLVLADDHINHIWFGEAWRRWVKFWSSEFCRIQPTSDGPQIIYMTWALRLWCAGRTGRGREFCFGQQAVAVSRWPTGRSAARVLPLSGDRKPPI
jgi:hypothetical protein